MYPKVSTLEGKIAAFIKNKTAAIVTTEFGDAFIDCNTEIDIHLKIGDNILIEETEFYVLNGRIFTVLQGKMKVNGVDVDCG
ncbi:MAG TPA: hypothetical protein VF817_03830 [Patescibacteria group bacterium]